MQRTQFVSNDAEFMLLDGIPGQPLFLFAHGYGSCVEDLLPLGFELNRRGFSCAFVLLSGHGTSVDELEKTDPATWDDQLQDALAHYAPRYDSILLVGFSLGATLCLKAAATPSVAGVVLISMFLTPTPLVRLGLKLVASLPNMRFRRRPRVTAKVTKQQLIAYHSLPTHTTHQVVDMAALRGDLLDAVQCPVLLLHSMDDKVADYEAIAHAVARGQHPDRCLLTLRGLNHFIQFDIPERALASLIIEFFKPADEVATRNELFLEAWKHAADEERHWSGTLFQLIAGFFPIFGALLYFSLPDVLDRKPSAPYFLVAYSLVTSFFLSLFSLYFFYMNRASVYRKRYIEPHLPLLGWTAFKTNRFASSWTSRSMTKGVSLSVIGMPFLISAGSLMYALYAYSHRLVIVSESNLLLMVSTVVAVISLSGAVGAALTLSSYTARELYRIPPSSFRSAKFAAAVASVLATVTPGCVTQPTLRSTARDDAACV
jgi:carboxylesterase